MEENRNIKMGDVKIADEVIAIIAGLAATEVPGVTYLSGGITRDMVPTTNVKHLLKSVRVAVNAGLVSVKVAICVNADISIPEVSSNVQMKVKDAIESMAGLPVTVVDVLVTGVNL